MGKSYHEIGLVRGQFGDLPREYWYNELQRIGYDGFEEAAWELDLSRCLTDEGAEGYAAEILKPVAALGLSIFTLAVHLQGQALGDEPSAKTLQFVGGQAVTAYKEWRKNYSPPRTSPLYVPEEVGRLIHNQALEQLLASVRLAAALGKLQNRNVALPGFVGSPAYCWSHFFEFPPVPKEIGGCPIPDPRKVSLELLVERFTPVWDLCKAKGVRFGLECHPSERAMGDLASAAEYLEAVVKAGYEGTVGFNFDASHMYWQGVDGVAFIREFAHHIHCAHIKGAWISKHPTRNGLLGGHQPMGHPDNGWNFVTPGTPRDAVPQGDIIAALTRVGYTGPICIEWEDNDVEKMAGAATALPLIRALDLPPSKGRHDETLKV